MASLSARIEHFIWRSHNDNSVASNVTAAFMDFYSEDHWFSSGLRQKSYLGLCQKGNLA